MSETSERQAPPMGEGHATQGAGPTRFCPACYAMNPWGAAGCERCGASLESPRDYDASLVWALDHPDGATAIRAAGVLAARRRAEAIDPLGRMSRRTDDPYRAAAAVRALREFEPDRRVKAYLAEAARHPSVIVRAAAARIPGARP